MTIGATADVFARKRDEKSTTLRASQSTYTIEQKTEQVREARRNRRDFAESKSNEEKNVNKTYAEGTRGNEAPAPALSSIKK